MKYREKRNMQKDNSKAKKLKYSHVCLLFVALLPFLLIGYSTEYRIEFADNKIYSTSDIYFRPFPMIMHNVTKSVQPIGIPIYEDDLVPRFYRLSKGYRSKGGWRIDMDKLLDLLNDDKLIDRINNDPRIRNVFINNIRDSKKDIFVIFKNIDDLIIVIDRNS